MKITYPVLVALAWIWLQSPVRINTADFKPISGDWTGKLTYLDYTTGKPYSMPANVYVSILPADTNQILLSYQYPDEPKANAIDTLVIGDDGARLNEGRLIGKSMQPDGSIQLETELHSNDGNDNKAATIKHIYIMSATKFESRKQVKFDGTSNWILRNEYVFRRK